jgi:hypothetical protein
MVIRIFIVCMCFLLLSSCRSKVQYPYDEKGLTYKDKLIFSKQIRLNGIYSTPYHDIRKYGIMIFYENGYCCCYSCRDIESDCIDTNNFRYMSPVPQYWGVYIITNDTIRIQRVSPNRGIFEKFKIYEETARIINDTTIFLMYKKYSEEKTRQHQLNQIYRFMPLENMPSSQNILMECKKCK